MKVRGAGAVLRVLVVSWLLVLPSSLSAQKNKRRLPKVRKDDLRVHTFALGGMLVDEKKKLMFCPIEKIASTQFRQLFYRLNDDDNWFEPPYHKKSSPRLGHYPYKRVMEMLTSPDWTRAVMFRDPAKRLLSSFVHLVLNPKTPARYRMALSNRHKNITWHDFVSAVLDEDGYDNIHWTPQNYFCGLRNYYPYLNFVGNFEKLQEHGELLNRRASLLDATTSGWGKCAHVKSPIRVGSTAQSRKQQYAMLLKHYTKNNVTNDCMWCKNLAPHKNDYKKHMAHEMLSLDIWRRLRSSKIYSPDYAMFEEIRQLGVRDKDSVGPFQASLYDLYNIEGLVDTQ